MSDSVDHHIRNLLEKVGRERDQLRVRAADAERAVRKLAQQLGAKTAQVESYKSALECIQFRGGMDDDESGIDALIGCIEIADEALDIADTPTTVRIAGYDEHGNFVEETLTLGPGPETVTTKHCYRSFGAGPAMDGDE